MKKNMVQKSVLTLLGILLVSMTHADGVTPPPPPQPACQDIVYSKWNDLLFVDNGENRFVSYQWFCDHMAIEGATRQYLYTHGVVLQGDGHVYYAMATMVDGVTVVSCEGSFDDFPRSAQLNPGDVSRAVLYTQLGHKVGEWTACPSSLSVNPGIYVWVLTDAQGHTWTEKAVY